MFDINANMWSVMAYSMTLDLIVFSGASIRNLVGLYLTLTNWKRYFEFYQTCIILLHCIHVLSSNMACSFTFTHCDVAA